MKEQDYIQIMNQIRKDHIEHAVMWENTAQQNRRSIRMLSTGIGAIAAAIAVCIGTIGYRNASNRFAANEGSGNDSLIADTTTMTDLTALTTDTDISVQETTETESVSLDAAVDADGRNVLGGMGKIHAFETYAATSKDYQFAEDDAYIYELGQGLRASKQDENPVFERFFVSEMPEYDPTSDQLAAVEGRCFLLKDGILYQITQGMDSTEPNTLTALLSIEEDIIGSEVDSMKIVQTVGFAKDENGNPTLVFMYGLADNSRDNSCYTFRGILDLQTGVYNELDTPGLSCATFIADDALYYVGENNEYWVPETERYTYLTKYTGAEPGEIIDITEWKLNTVCTFVDGDGVFWFQNFDGQFCRASYGDETPTILSDEVPFLGGGQVMLSDVNQVLSNTAYPSDIVISNCDGSDMETVLVSNDESAFLNGAFVDDGVIHIIAEKYGQLIYVIKDGEHVESRVLALPEEYWSEVWRIYLTS